jgi:pSer/pThr/pTyr-binding forkhead associated (FHA) protein
MGTIVFVEVMDRQDQVKQQIPVSQFPVSIGRAYSNDIIIDDPYICPVHARIDYNDDGDIILIDADSKNGIKYLGKIKDTNTVSPQNGLTVKLGNTKIRFRSPEFISEATRTQLSKSSRVKEVIDSKPYIFILILLALSYLILRIYLSSYMDFVATGVMFFFPSCIFITIWCTGWSLLNRILAARFNFLFHLLLLSSAVLVFGIIDTSTSYLSFIMSMNILPDMLFGYTIAFLAGLLLFGHLSIIGNIRFRTRLIFKTSYFVLVGLFSVFMFFDKQSVVSDRTSYNYDLKPITERLIPSISPEEFFNKTEVLIYKLKKEH